MIQGRVVGSVEGQEILTVNGAIGTRRDEPIDRVWIGPPPTVPAPEDCPPRRIPNFTAASIFDRIDVRLARGLTFEELSGPGPLEGEPDSVLWARVPGHLEPSAATLAIIGDYVTGGVSQALGRRAMSRSLDNTLRTVRMVPTEWVLCEIHIQAVTSGYGQGTATLWAEDGTLLATASQSMGIRLWD